MKKLLSLLLAMMMLFTLALLPALAETSEGAAEETADAVEGAAEETADAVEDAAEKTADAVEDAAEETADAVEGAAEETVEETKEEAQSWFDKRVRGFYLKDLFGMSTPALIALIALVVIGVALIAAGRKQWTARTISHAAICIAIAFVLSCIRLFRMPSGGSVVLCAMLPMIAFSAAYGFGPGLAACVAYGLLQIAQGAWIVHPVQGLLDYIVAYAVLCLGFLAPKLPAGENWKLPIAVVIACFARYAVHVVSGMVFFASDAADAGQAPFVYSALYNLFLAPEAALCAVIAATPAFRRVFAALRKGAKA